MSAFVRLSSVHRSASLRVEPNSRSLSAAPVERATTIELVGTTDAAATQAWLAIADRSPAIGAYDRLDFIAAGAEACSAVDSVRLAALVRHGDGLVRSILPLRVTRKLGAVIAQGVAAPMAQYTDCLGSPLSVEDLESIGARLREAYAVDLVLLRKVRRDGGLWPALSALGLSQNALTTAPYIDLSAFRNFAAYDASFSRTTRRSRKQRARKLEERVGQVRFQVQPGAAAAAETALAIRWKRAWLTAQGLKSPVLDDDNWGRALQRAAALPHAVVSVLYGADRPLAIELGFMAGADYSSYLGAYDPAFATYGVGQLQLYKTIEWAFAQNVARFDLLAPDSEYKQHWSRSGTCVDVDDFALPLSQLGRAMADLRRHLRPLARSVILGLTPEVRLAGQRYGVPAGIATAMGLAIAATLE